MNRTLLWTGATCAFIFGGSAGALAGPTFEYNWTPNVTIINSDPVSFPGLPSTVGRATLQLQSTAPDILATTSTNVIAAQLWGNSQAPWNIPAHFTNDKYSLSVTLTDFLADPHGPGTVGQSGVLTFQGMLNGTVWTRGSLVTNTFIGPTTQSVVLDNVLYTVTIGPFLPPGPPGLENAGAIGASITQTPLLAAAAPEPSTLALAGLGLSMAGLAAWRKRRRLASPA